MLQSRPLSEDLQRTAKEELNEVPERLAEEVRILKTWIEQQPFMDVWANTDDQLLIAFLRGCKHNLQKAKSKINAYFTWKRKFPAMFNANDVDKERFREIFRLGLYLYLPTPLHDNGPRILLIRTGVYPAGKYSLDELLVVYIALQDILMLEDDNAVIKGLIIICDFKTFTISHCFYLNPIKLKRLIAFSDEALATRIKSAQNIYTPKAFEFFYRLVKPLLAKQQKRLFVHSNMDSLAGQIPLKYLPKDYGGENGSVAEIIDEWDKILNKYREYFKRSHQIE
uniref:CRAL-TRIO domain-containing protein n=1 Tax=Glossina morsitans morsitans TaxID=37546 RepID=A0A1B0G0L4_GLOMM